MCETAGETRDVVGFPEFETFGDDVPDFDVGGAAVGSEGNFGAVRGDFDVFDPDIGFFGLCEFCRFFVAFDEFVTTGTGLFDDIDVDVGFHVSDGEELTVPFPVNGSDIAFELFALG